MKKPKKITFEPVYEYTEIIKYIEKKYKIKTTNYKPKFDKQYRNFWHYCMEANGNNVSNGSFIHLPEWGQDDQLDNKDWWVDEIMQLIIKEFYPQKHDWEDMKVWVEW